MITLEIVIDAKSTVASSLVFRRYGNSESTNEEKAIAHIIRSLLRDEVPTKIIQHTGASSVVAIERQVAGG